MILRNSIGGMIDTKIATIEEVKAFKAATLTELNRLSAGLNGVEALREITRIYNLLNHAENLIMKRHYAELNKKRDSVVFPLTVVFENDRYEIDPEGLTPARRQGLINLGFIWDKRNLVFYTKDGNVALTAEEL